MVKTFIVEDSPLLLDTLIATLEETAPVRVVGHAPDETTALQALRKLDGDVQLIIIDIFLKAGSGLGVLRRIEEAGLAAQRVVLTNYATPTMRATCAALGADRVFDKCGDLDELLSFCANLGGGAPPRLAPHRGG